MKIILGLHVVSTGETITEKETQFRAITWQKKIEKKLLRLRNRAERFKVAIKDQDTVVAWVNLDDLIAEGYLPVELATEWRRIFKGYDRWFNERLGSPWDGYRD